MALLVVVRCWWELAAGRLYGGVRRQRSYSQPAGCLPVAVASATACGSPPAAPTPSPDHCIAPPACLLCVPFKQKLTDDMDDYWKSAPKKGEAKAAEEPAEPAEAAAEEAPEAAAEGEAAAE